MLHFGTHGSLEFMPGKQASFLLAASQSGRIPSLLNPALHTRRSSTPS